MAERASIAQYANLVSAFFVEASTSDTTAKAQTQAENAARPAICEWTYVSTGIGQLRVAKPILFGISFRTEPHFTTGSATIKNPDAKNWHDPVGNAGVRSWERDSRGLFVGAHIWVRVDMYPLTDATADAATTASALPLAKTKTLHYLTFSGNAIKDIPSPTSQVLSTRRVGVA